MTTIGCFFIVVVVLLLLETPELHRSKLPGTQVRNYMSIECLMKGALSYRVRVHKLFNKLSPKKK